MPKSQKILLFDIDGTLLLTGGAGKFAFNFTFRDLFGIEEAWRDIQPDGKTDPLIISELSQRVLGRELLPEEFSQVRKKYHQYFLELIDDSPRFHVLPGIPELMRALEKLQGIHMGLATGNFEESAYLKLKRGELRSYFKFGGFGSDCDNRLDLTQTAYERACRFLNAVVPLNDTYVIGDTVHDIRAGKFIGAKTVAVATGKTTLEELKQETPDHLFSNFENTRAFLDILT